MLTPRIEHTHSDRAIVAAILTLLAAACGAAQAADTDSAGELVVAGGVKPYSSKGGRPSWYGKGSGSPRWVLKRFDSVRWSPDGSRLAFSSDLSDDGYFYVHIVPAAGSAPQRLDATRVAESRAAT